MGALARGSLVALVCLVAWPAGAAVVRIVGLDRLYFERVAIPGPPSVHADVVRDALAETLAGALPSGGTSRDASGYEVEVSVTDFPVPGPGRGRDLVLRQVIDRSRRIHLVWWALYAAGSRQEVWHFEALPPRTGNKALANPSIYALRAAGGGAIEVDLLCTMSRPQGAEWRSTWALSFDVTPEGLAYRRAEERCGMSRGYDTGAGSETSCWVADRRRNTVTITSADRVPDAVLSACEPETGDEGEAERAADLERFARCVTSKAKSSVSSHPADRPAFIERGGTGAR